jgi:Toxin co-regulated pilus biosynthesis protein Q
MLCCAFGVLTSCVPAPKHEMSWERINIKPADSVGLCDKPKAALQINDDPSRSTVRDENLKEKVNVGSVRTAKIDKKFVDRASSSNTDLTQKPIIPNQAIDESDRVSIVKKETWSVRSGKTLRSVIEDWSKQSGWDYRYQLADDWQILSSFDLQGSFESAINQLERKLKKQGVPIEVYFKETDKFILIAEPSGKNL